MIPSLQASTHAGLSFTFNFSKILIEGRSVMKMGTTMVTCFRGLWLIGQEGENGKVDGKEKYII